MKFIRFNEILIKWYIGVKTNWRNNQNRVQLYPDWYQKSDENCAINNYTRLQEWMCSKCYGGKLEGILKQSLLVIIEDRRGSRKKVFQYKRRSYLSQQEASDISEMKVVRQTSFFIREFSFRILLDGLFFIEWFWF